MIDLTAHVNAAPHWAGRTAAVARRLSGALSARQVLGLVLLAGLVCRLVLLAATAHVALKTDDERDYFELARSIVDGRGFSMAALGTTSIRPPLYPAFIALAWRVTGQETLQAVRAAQVGLSLGTVLLVFCLARKVYDQRTALVAAALWAVFPSFLYGGMLVLAEVLFTFLLLATCVLAIETIERVSGWTALATGVTLGLAALTRSVLWPLPLLLVPLAAASLRAPWRSTLAVSASLLAGYLLVVAPWAVRNTRLQGTLSVVDTMGGLNLRMGNFEHTIEDRMWDGVSLTGDRAWAHQMFVEHPDARRWTEGQKEKWAQRAALTYMWRHPLTTARRAALKFADFWGLEREYIAALSKGAYEPPLWFAVTSSAATLLCYPAVMLLAICALFTARPHDSLKHAWLLLVVLFVCGIHTLVFGHSRYHLPVMPIVVIYAAAAIGSRSWRSMSRAQSLGVASTCGFFVLAWTREIAFRDASRIAHFLRFA